MPTLSDDSDDDFLLPDESSKPKTKPPLGTSNPTPAAASAVPAARASSPGGSAASGGGAGSGWGGAPSIASSGSGGGASYASSLLAQRRQGLAKRHVSPTARSPTAQGVSGFSQVSPAPAAQATPKAAESTPKVEPQKSPALQPMAALSPPSSPEHPGQGQTVAKASPAATLPPAESSTVAAAPPPPSQEERILALQKEIEEKKAALERSKAEEERLLKRRKERKAEHEEQLAKVERELRELWREVEDEKARTTAEVMAAEEEQERFLRDEKARVEASVAKEAEPELAALRTQLKELKEQKAKLSHGISTSSANRDLLNSAIAAAMHSIADRLKTDFEDTVLNDEGWEEHVRHLVHAEVGDSVTRALRGDEESERHEQEKAFGEMLEFWRQAEEEERQQILKMDDQLLLDMQSMAGDDLDRMQREEMAMQQVYMEGREAWAKHHRQTMNDELEAAIRRRDEEFEQIRSDRVSMHRQKLQAIEEQHKNALQMRNELHEREIKVIRDEYAMKQLLREERSKAELEAQQRASEAVAALDTTSEDIAKLINKVDEYRLSVDKVKDSVDGEKAKHLEEHEQSLKEIQDLITAQSSSIEAERRSLAGTVVKLEVVHSTLQKQMEDERTWVGQLLGKLERSKSDWEREYRRWQHLTQQEQQAVEQRFSSVLLELRAAASALEDESRELDIEAASLRRRCEERAAKAAEEVADIARKEEAVNERYSAMMNIVGDLEVKGSRLAAEWQTLQEERQQLNHRRQDFIKEKSKMERLANQLQEMKGAVDSAKGESLTMAERAKVLQQQIQRSQAVVDYDAKMLSEQASRLTRDRDNLTREQGRLSDMVSRQHHRYSNVASARPQHGGHPGAGGDRLPSRILGELREVLTSKPISSTAPATRSQGDDGGKEGERTAATFTSHVDPSLGGTSYNFTRWVDPDSTTASSSQQHGSS